VKVSGGVATLSGDVPTEQLKARAERLASRVKGVTSVTNNIVVKP
jgi:osmotically-inducible protein OsmY